MTVDESSSQDATLIDDDLVAALGFEPVQTIEPGDDDAISAESGNGSAEVVTDSDDSVARDVDPSDVGDSGLNGFGVDIVDDQPVDDIVIVDDSAVDDTAVDDTAVDDTAVDDTAVEGDMAEAPAVEGAVIDEVVIDEADGEEGAVDGEWSEQVIGDVDIDDIDVDLEGRPETDTDLDIDADADADADLEVEPDAVIDLDELDGGLDSAIDTETDSETDSEPEGDAIDDAPALAEADDVFADGEIAVGERDSDFYDYPVSAPTLDGPVIGETVTDAGDTDAAAAAAVAPAVAAPRIRRKRKIRARKSRRVIRHIDPWSVLTFSVLFHMVVFASLLLSSVLVWNAAIASGMVENVESFIQELGDYETFEINADVMFQAAIVIAGMLTLASSVMVVLLTVVFNLISDLVGGIRVTVIEEETVRVPLDKNRRDDRVFE